jgi:hypothetical protein
MLSIIYPARTIVPSTAKICGRICGLLVVSLLLISCTNFAVQFTKKPLTVKREYFDPVKDKGKIPLVPGEEALTVWSFGCKTDFKFDVIDKVPLGKNDYMVTVKIRQIHMTLTAPVTVYLPDGAPPLTVQHEDAHVAICKKVYGGIDSESKMAARSVIGAVYQDSGPTVEQACQRCIERASADVYERYQSKTSFPVNRVSEIFDDLSRNSDESPDLLVKKAFSKYQEIQSVR